MNRTRRTEFPACAAEASRHARATLAVVLLAASLPGPVARAADPDAAGATAAAAEDTVTSAQSPADTGPEAAIDAGAAAAAERPPTRNPDPFERVNRATFAFNDGLDRMLARPAARLYRAVVPEGGRTAVTNVMSNFEEPTTALNSALQGKFKDAGQSAARFVVNATIGIGGLFDPATRFGLPRHDEDFGQTLGAWGVPSGPFLVMPGFGPSTVRDAPSRLVDRYTNARRYIGDGSTEWVLFGIDLIDTRAQLLQADIALRTAFDPYALVRNAFLQRREYLVRDGQVPEENFEDFYDEPYDDEPAEAAPPDAPPEAGADAAASGTASAADTAAAPDGDSAQPRAATPPAA